MKKIVNLVIFVLILFSCQSKHDAVSDTVVVDYKVGINYVTHLYTIAHIGFVDEEYFNKYSHTISPEDIQILQKYHSLLGFAHGETGILTSYFFFIPAYADLKSKSDYMQYRDDFDIAMKNKSCESVRKYFPDNQKEMLCQMFSVSDDEWQQILSVNEAFQEIMNVFINNIDTYLTDVFPSIEKDLNERTEYLNDAVRNMDVISKWEEVTGFNWSFGNNTYLLYRAGKNGPSFNNLSENINTLYYKLDTDYTLDMFSHEFGIFLMYDSIMPLSQEYKNTYPAYESEVTLGRVNWMAFEMLSTFFNCKINDRKTLDYYNFGNSDPVAFMTIYEELYSQGITNPKEMYEKGVEEYMKPNGMWNTGVEDRNKEYIKEKEKL